MGMKLFDDVVDNDELEKIEINPEFAKRYEHNKKREDLQKYEEMKKKGIIDSGSESETESESDVDDRDDTKQFLDGILRIRKKDPSLLAKDAKLFESDDDEDEDGEEDKKPKKVKPKYLKDVIAQNLIEKGSEFDSDEDDYPQGDRKVKSFVEEQEDLRNEVLAALAAEESKNGDEDDGSEDGLLREKKRDDGDEEEETVDDEINEKLDEYFGKGEQLDKNEMFLKEFFKNKLWIDKGKNNVVDDDEDIDLSEDEDAVLKQEEYERDYNFRYEESKGDRVLGHSRKVEGSVRIGNNTRREARDRKKKREEEAEMERAEEVKRLKNLKRKESDQKIKKILEIAGLKDDERIPVKVDDLEKDFDPLEYDQAMKTAFGDDYYMADDVDSEFKGVGSDNEGEGELEKPNFDKEDELLGLPKDWDVINSKDGFLAKRGKRVISQMSDEDDEEEVEEEVEGKRKRKRKSKLAEALRKDLEEELYKYDYEDAIGDLKTRFKYQKVKPDRYKLSAAEILWLDEQELNQYVSLKKLATYREQEWKVAPIRKKMLIDGLLSAQTKQKRMKMGEEGTSKTTDETQTDDGVKLSRSARRRRNQKEKKLPQSRLAAYGKMPTGSKKSKN